MALSSISCSLKPPAPVREPRSSNPCRAGGLRRACVAAAACVVIGAAGGGEAVLAWGDAAAPHGAVAAVGAQAPARWSDRRQCPPWRANSLENIVPENLPRPSARRRFNSITAAERPAAPSPDAVLPFLALHSGMGCFSL